MRQLSLFLIATFAACTLAAQPAKYVVLISIDGLRPDFYQDSRWPAPNLQQLKAHGSHADGVRGVFPTVTYPSHTTLVTGVAPAIHGVYYNSPFEPDSVTGRWYWEASSIRVPTLWDAAKTAGMKTAAISWPVTVGAPITYNVPEVWSLDRNVERTAAVRKEATPAGLVEEIEANATGKLSGDALNSDYLTIDENLARMAHYLIRTYKPRLTALHLVCVDHFEHGEGREGPGVVRAVASADRAVGKVLEALELAGIADSTAIIITGDHGFVDIHTTVAPNVWLAQAGLAKKQGGRIEWRTRFHTTGASAFLHLKDKKDVAAVQQVRSILAAQPAGIQKLFRIVERAELDRIGADPAAVLALAPVPGINLSSALEGEAIRRASGGTHGYMPDFAQIHTGFVAAGAGIAQGGTVPLMDLADVALLIARLLGLDLKTADGVVYPGLVKEGKR